MNRPCKLPRTAPGITAGVALALLLAGCLSPLPGARADQAMEAAWRACAGLPEMERYACIAASAVEAAGLSWQECLVRADVEEWPQAEACFGHPTLGRDNADQARAGERTAYGHRLAIGADVYATREIATPIPNLSIYTLSMNGRPQKLFLGHFTTYSPDLGLENLAGRAAWTFDDGHAATVVYDGADLRKVYGFEAVYAPYVIRDRLIFVARQAGHYFVVYDGRRFGPVFDRILIAYCCEPAAYSARGASGRYTFRGERDGERYMVEISRPTER